MTSTKLDKLIALCKGGVSLQVNEHKNYYQPIEEYLREMEEIGRMVDSDSYAAIKQEMIARDTAIYLHFYPDTPVGFYELWHYDLDQCLDIAIECIVEDRKV